MAAEEEENEEVGSVALSSSDVNYSRFYAMMGFVLLLALLVFVAIILFA